jgi:hypothetical protein
MMKKGLLVVILAILGVSIPLVAAAADAVGIDFSIRFFDRRVYYAESDPVFVQVTITNNSPATYRFKLADERVFSLDFDVRTITNRSLEASDVLIRKRTQYQQIFFRAIAVESGESFSFVEDLQGYVKLSEPGAYVVSARVYPELYRSDTVRTNISTVTAAAMPVLESGRLSLNIRPAVIPGPDGIPLELDVATGAVLVRERLAPDQVVDYMITGRQRSQWERFFLYLDIETMLANDSVRRRRWVAEGEEGRRRMLEQYRQELRESTTDGTISNIPTEYTIERTQYNSTDGTVTVLQKYRSRNFTEVKRYTYLLQRKDDIWAIVDYSVVNLGTE